MPKIAWSAFYRWRRSCRSWQEKHPPAIHMLVALKGSSQTYCLACRCLLLPTWHSLPPQPARNPLTCMNCAHLSSRGWPAAWAHRSLFHWNWLQWFLLSSKTELWKLVGKKSTSYTHTDGIKRKPTSMPIPLVFVVATLVFLALTMSSKPSHLHELCLPILTGLIDSLRLAFSSSQIDMDLAQDWTKHLVITI